MEVGKDSVAYEGRVVEIWEGKVWRRLGVVAEVGKVIVV